MDKFKKGKKVYSGWEKLPGGQRNGDIQAGCLVIEGGAFRGLYHEGVLDALLEGGINIHTVIGTSAGALAGLHYVTGQIGRPARINLGYRHDSRFVGIKGFLKTGCLVNVDFPLYDYGEVDPIDVERLNSPDRHFVAVATNCLTGETAYLDKNNCSDMVRAAKASASMQYTSPMVMIDGIPYLDGGCSCDIPYQWAEEQGFDKIVIIRSLDRSFRKKEKRSKLAKIFYRKYPAFAESVSRKTTSYNKECDAVAELEKSGRAYVIAPKEPVTVRRMESDMEKLGALYWQGYKDAEEQLEAIRTYLGE